MSGHAVQFIKVPTSWGKETTANLAFVKSKWLLTTDEWMEKVEVLKVKKVEEIIELAQGYASKSVAATVTPNQPGNVQHTRPNPCIQLHDADDSDGDDDDADDSENGQGPPCDKPQSSGPQCHLKGIQISYDM